MRENHCFAFFVYFSSQKSTPKPFRNSVRALSKSTLTFCCFSTSIFGLLESIWKPLGRSSWSHVRRKCVPQFPPACFGTNCKCFGNWHLILLPFEKGLGGVLARLGRSSWSHVSRKCVPQLTSACFGTNCLCIYNWHWILLPFLKGLGRVLARLDGHLGSCPIRLPPHLGLCGNINDGASPTRSKGHPTGPAAR